MEVDYCKVYKCACVDVDEVTQNQYVCGMQCLGCKDKETRIRGQRANGNFYEDSSLMYDEKQVDEVLQKFVNKNKIAFEKEYDCIWVGSENND